MKNKILIPTFFALIWLVILAVADIPPPPVNENYGIYDTNMTNYNETLCRNCHNSAIFSTGFSHDSSTIGGVPTRHHNLVVNNTTNPFTSQKFQCTDCHPSGVNGILLDRNCMNCHNGTTFWGTQIGNVSSAQIGNVSRPHHNTTHTQMRDCKFCHGALVDNYNDNHFIPNSSENETTPSSLYKVFNSTSGRVWGGCLACHAENASASPPIFFTQTNPTPVNGKYTTAPVADGNNNVHHDEILRQMPNVVILDRCSWCHPNLLNVLDIRGCEMCHSIRSIHNTQLDFENTSTLNGYGHIGSNNSLDPKNNSWDCNGCHSWSGNTRFNSTNVYAGTIIPDIRSTTPMVINVNMPKYIILNGTNFVQAGDNTTVNIDNSTDLIPNNINNDQINVTLNITTVGNHYVKVVKTDPIESIPSVIRPLTVVSNPIIKIAKLISGHLLIFGTGFGNSPITNAHMYVDINTSTGNIFYSDNIWFWNNNLIVANSSIAAINDTVIVITATTGSGEASIKII